MKRSSCFATLVIVALGSPSHAAPAAAVQDCAKAGSAVAAALCDSRDGSGGDLGWLADTMETLSHALQASLPTAAKAQFAEDQDRWLRSRDACHGGHDAVVACLSASYRRRLVALSNRFVGPGPSGVYERRFGEMDVVAMPDGALAFDIESSRGPPDYNMCSLQGTVRLQGGHGRTVLATDEGGKAGTDKAGTDVCTIDVETTASGFSVASRGCAYFCGYGATVDGVYAK